MHTRNSSPTMLTPDPALNSSNNNDSKQFTAVLAMIVVCAVAVSCFTVFALRLFFMAVIKNSERSILQLQSDQDLASEFEDNETDTENTHPINPSPTTTPTPSRDSEFIARRRRHDNFAFSYTGTSTDVPPTRTYPSTNPRFSKCTSTSTRISTRKSTRKSTSTSESAVVPTFLTQHVRSTGGVEGMSHSVGRIRMITESENQLRPISLRQFMSERATSAVGANRASSIGEVRSTRHVGDQPLNETSISQLQWYNQRAQSNEVEPINQLINPPITKAMLRRTTHVVKEPTQDVKVSAQTTVEIGPLETFYPNKDPSFHHTYR